MFYYNALHANSLSIRRKRYRAVIFCKKLLTFLISRVGLCIFMIGYGIVGAIVFQAIEAPFEAETMHRVAYHRHELVDFSWNTVYQNETIGYELNRRVLLDQLLDYKKFLMSNIRQGYNLREAKLSKRAQWTLAGAFLYSLTSISTVGYGNIVCRTYIGKAITILYAVVGIPLMLLFLAMTGNSLGWATKYAYRAYLRVRVRLVAWNHRRNQTRVSSALSEMIRQRLLYVAAMYGVKTPTAIDPDLLEHSRAKLHEVVVPIYLSMLIMVSYLIAGALLFSVWEDWEFLDSFYFCFISLALIGFGDLLPTAAEDKMIICSCYLLFGMALIAMCFQLGQEDVVKNLRTLFFKFLRFIRSSDKIDVSTLNQNGVCSTNASLASDHDLLSKMSKINKGTERESLIRSHKLSSVSATAMTRTENSPLVKKFSYRMSPNQIPRQFSSSPLHRRVGSHRTGPGSERVKYRNWRRANSARITAMMTVPRRNGAPPNSTRYRQRRQAVVITPSSSSCSISLPKAQAGKRPFAELRNQSLASSQETLKDLDTLNSSRRPSLATAAKS